MTQEKIIGMRSKFHDIDTNTEYDKLIEDSRKRMEKQNPSERVAELEFTISSLKSMKDTYWTRPPEGFCFGFFTPHKPRIERRIASLESEKKAHIIEEKEYKEQEKQKHDDEQAQKQRVLQKEIEEMKNNTEIQKLKIYFDLSKPGQKTETVFPPYPLARL